MDMSFIFSKISAAAVTGLASGHGLSKPCRADRFSDDANTAKAVRI